MIDKKHPNIELTAQDRCDRCVAQAYAVYRKGDLELSFCLHHVKDHNFVLEVEGWTPHYDYAGIERLVDTERVTIG